MWQGEIDFGHAFDHAFDPTDLDLVLIGTVLPVVGGVLAVLLLVLLPVLLRRRRGTSRTTVFALFAGDFLLFLLLAGSLAVLRRSPTAGLGLFGLVFLLALVPTLKLAADGALFALVSWVGIPHDGGDAAKPARKPWIPWIAGIAAVAVCLSVAGFGLLLAADAAANREMARTLDAVLFLLVSLLLNGGTLLAFAMSVVVGATTPRRLRESGAPRRAVVLASLSWIFPGGIVLALLVAILLGIGLFIPAVNDGVLQIAPSVAVAALASLFLLPTFGVALLSSACLVRGKEAPPMPAQGDEVTAR